MGRGLWFRGTECGSLCPRPQGGSGTDPDPSRPAASLAAGTSALLLEEAGAVGKKRVLPEQPSTTVRTHVFRAGSCPQRRLPGQLRQQTTVW